MTTKSAAQIRADELALHIAHLEADVDRLHRIIASLLAQQHPQKGRNN